MQIRQILLKPIITEKSMQQAAAGQYTFTVAKTATKKEVAQTVEKLFGAEVYRVSIHNRRGKIRRSLKTGSSSAPSLSRRALVAINPKDKIDLFEVSNLKEESAQEENAN